MKSIVNISCILIVIFFLMSAGVLRQNKNENYRRDYVPNEETAIKVAEAIWLPIYGDDIYNDTPFKATLKDSSIWIVEGTLNNYEYGGVPYIEIQKKDCKVLKVTHGK